jgi:hypothetical protein
METNRKGEGQMEANLTPEERFRLEVQVRKARRLQAEEARRQALAERKAELANGARFVAMFADGREGERYVSRYGGQPIWDRDRAAEHADRQCQAIKGMQGTEVRDATPGEVANMEPCGHRVCRIARGEDIEDSGSERLAEPQGDSVRTVSGGAFESNRRRH